MAKTPNKIQSKIYKKIGQLKYLNNSDGTDTHDKMKIYILLKAFQRNKFEKQSTDTDAQRIVLDNIKTDNKTLNGPFALGELRAALNTT